ncbi:MAG: hypothetical protein JWM34_1433 [Ilumatobacteraceae bacterium]|nr:hypothetical protein [Ilumatobacteraceae bacterium]
MSAIAPPRPARPAAAPMDERPEAPEDEAPALSAGQRASATLPATLALTTLSIVTAIGFCRVFAGWEFLAPLLVVIIGVHAASYALRVIDAPGYVAIPVLVLVLFVLIAWRYYPDTLSGPFPTSQTWKFLSDDIRLASAQFPSAVAPVAAVGGFAVAAATASGVAAMLSDAFAFRAFGRAEAAVPTAVLFVFAAALGIDNHRVTLTAAWLAAALALIAVLRMTHAANEHTWIGSRSRVLLSMLPLAIALAAGAALSGAVVGPRLPGAGEKGVIDTRDRNSVTQVLSPLVTIRSQLVNESNVELFTVASSEPHYWRASGLTKFDGTTWGIPEGSKAGNFEAPVAGSRSLPQSIHILGLGGPLLPVAYTPTRISGGNTYYVPLTDTVVEPDAGIQRGTTYDVVSSVLDLTPDELRAASSAGAPAGMLDLPSSFPTSVVQTAQQITAGATTVYDKAIALQTWFRDNFTYDLSIQRGHSDDALENFLRIRRGYCEQFSAAFASMARSVGVPARVAVGFTYGELGTDGLYHVYGRDAHAWPEVWFDGLGWVSFEPTPGRGEPGTQSYTNVKEAQATANADSTDDTSDGTADTSVTQTTAASATGATPTTLANPVSPSTTTPANVLPAPKGSGGGISGGLLAVIVILVAAALWAFALPRILAWMARRRAPASAAERIAQSWERTASAFAFIELGPAVGETPIEHARRVERMTGIDRRTLEGLALDATAAIYGGVGDDATADHCAASADDIVRSIRNRLGPRGRMATFADPRRGALLTS